MKNQARLLCMFAFSVVSLCARAQLESDRLDLPGDNLNLYAVFRLFEESETLEKFERELNAETTRINNLDLNGDGKVDYIKVIDNVDENVHSIALQVDVSADEQQDIAVFVVQKDEKGGVQIQLIGDEDLYGQDYIIEPNLASIEANRKETPNPGYNDIPPEEGIRVVTTYEVATWPVVRFIFMPGYVVWHPLWHWQYYPPYWHAWKPFYWHYYYGYHYHWRNYYRSRYRRWDRYRNPLWRERYYNAGKRSSSGIVSGRLLRGDFNGTYSKPRTAKAGAREFRKTQRDRASSREKLPSFDRNGRPRVEVKENNQRRSETTFPPKPTVKSDRGKGRTPTQATPSSSRQPANRPSERVRESKPDNKPRLPERGASPPQSNRGRGNTH